MLKLVKNVFCLFLAFEQSLVIASQSSKPVVLPHKNPAALSHDDRERNAKIEQVMQENAEIFKSSNMIYAVTPIYPACMNNPEDIEFVTAPIKPAYLADMINKSYIAPMKIFKQGSYFVVKTVEDLFEGDFIGMYAGNVVKNSIHPSLPLHSQRSVMRHKSKPEEAYIIDASGRGNELNFIPKAHFGSNCQWVDVLGKDGRAHVVCVASRYISQGGRLVVQETVERLLEENKLKYQAMLAAAEARSVAYNQALQSPESSFVKASATQS